MTHDVQPSRLSDKQQAEFLREFMAGERRIRMYVRALVPDREAADELFQETSVTLLEKFDSDKSGDAFVGWACRVAWYKVLQWRQCRARDRLRFTESAMKLIADCAVEVVSETEDRQLAMRHCMQRISRANLGMLTERYRDDVPVEQIAERSGRTVAAVHKALSRIRIWLHDCIHRQLLSERRAT